MSETTSDDSSKDKGPVGNVVFVLCNSIKLIVAQPVDTPSDNVSKLPILDWIYFFGLGEKYLNSYVESD